MSMFLRTNAWYEADKKLHRDDMEMTEIVNVNNPLEPFIEGGASAVNTFNEIAADYDIQASDVGKIIEAESGSAIVITVPADADATIEAGSEIAVIRAGAGTVTFALAVGVTIRSKDSLLSIGSQFAGATLIKKSANLWYLIGDLA